MYVSHCFTISSSVLCSSTFNYGRLSEVARTILTALKDLDAGCEDRGVWKDEVDRLDSLFLDS